MDTTEKNRPSLENLVENGVLGLEILLPGGFGGQLKVFVKVLRMSGIRGIQNVWESGQIFQSEHIGYGITVGRVSSN